MTYLQLLNKALNYLIQEPIMQEDFSFWAIIDDKSKEEFERIKDVAKKGQSYLILKVLYEQGLLNVSYQKLFYYLEKQLSTTWLSKEIQEQAKQIAKQMLMEDAFYQDAAFVLQDPGIYENYSVYQLEQLKIYKEELEQQAKEEMKLYMNTNQKIIQNPMENMVYVVLPVLAKMYFSKQTSQYIKDCVLITDTQLQEKCYEYIQNNVSLYAWDRQAIYDPKMLRYTTKLIQLVYTLAMDKQNDAMENLIEIDDCLMAEDISYTSLFELLYYNELNEEIKLNDSIGFSSKRDADFFLSFTRFSFASTIF